MSGNVRVAATKHEAARALAAITCTHYMYIDLETIENVGITANNSVKKK